MRLIDADKLIVKLHKRLCKIDNGRTHEQMSIPVADGMRMGELEYCIGAIYCEPIIEVEHVRHGWISVKEQMPPTGNDVLVAVHNKNMAWRCVTIDTWDGNWVENADSDWHIVTHWMPIPEPPKEEL